MEPYIRGRIRKHSDGTIWIPREDKALEAALDAEHTRVPGQLRWIPKPGWVEQATLFAKAVTSTPVSAEVLSTRVATCAACPMLTKDTAGNTYCGGCNCGKWPIARVDGSVYTKLTFSGSKCPLAKW